MTRATWINLEEFPEIQKTLKTEGKEYTDAFSQAVREVWRVESRVLSLRRVQQGVIDGSRWAMEFGTPELTARLMKVASENNRPTLGRASTCDAEPFCPAHDFLTDLLGTAYPTEVDESGEEFLLLIVTNFVSSGSRSSMKPWMNSWLCFVVLIGCGRLTSSKMCITLRVSLQVLSVVEQNNNDSDIMTANQTNDCNST